MPNKKQSARPAESGWLLEIGVLGVAKSLLWMEKTGRSLLEIEHVLRSWRIKGLSDKDHRLIASKRREVAREPWANPGFKWDGTTWKSWTEAVKVATGRKGKALFMPLRLALTGLDHGPELAQLLPLIGRDRALERLS